MNATRRYRWNVRTGLLLLAPFLLCAGCYTFDAAAIESVRPGMDVRARLSAVGRERVTDLTGDRRGTVDGSLVRTDAETVVLSVWRTDLLASNFEPGRLELPLQRDDIVRLERKRLSVPRTGGVFAGMAAGLYLLVRFLWEGAGGGSLPGDGGGDDI